MPRILLFLPAFLLLFCLSGTPSAFACTPEKETAIDYCACAGKLRKSNPEEGVQKAAKGIALAKESRQPIERAKCLTAMSGNLILLQKTDSARLVLEQALAIYQDARQEKGIAQCYHLLGLTAYYQQDLWQAKQFYLQATALQRKLSLEKALAGTINNLGLVSFSMHQYDSALRYFQEALDLKKKLGQKSSIASTLNNIGSVKGRMYRHEEALQYYKEALKWDIKNKNEYGKAVSYCNISNEFGALQAYDSVIIYLKEAEEIFRSLHLSDGLATVHNNLGAAYLEHLDLPELAVHHFQEALSGFRALSFHNDTHTVYSSLAKAFLALEQPEKARLYLDSAAHIQPHVSSRESIYRYHFIASSYHEAVQEAEQALQSYKTFVQLRDSLSLAEQDDRLQELEVARENERKERELVLLRKTEKIASLKQQLFLGLSVAAGLLFLITLLYSLFRVKREKDIRLAQKRLHESQQHLMQEKYKNLQLANEQLDKTLELKRHELTSQALFLLEKQRFIEELKQGLQKLSSHLSDPQLRKGHDKLVHQLKTKLNLQNDRLMLEEKAAPYLSDFYQKLEEQVPGITENEKRLASLLRTDLSSKEIAVILGIEPKSVDMRRYRLRKKLGIAQDDKLSAYFKAL